MSKFSIVGKKFSPSAFADYAAHVPLGDWLPKLIVLHNTANPALRDRRNGLTAQHIEDLHFYYQFQAPKKNGKGWSGGPHLFVDQTGIWVFNPLDRPGVHSPSWNSKSWGIEMLGDFASEPFDSGDGLRVQTNTMSALAALFHRLGVSTVTNANFKFHKEDPATDHVCPGKNVDKPKVMTAVQALLTAAPVGTWPEIASKVVVYRKSSGQSPFAVIDADLRGGTLYADAQDLSEATGIATSETGQIPVRPFVEAKFSILWVAETHRAYLGELA